MEPVKVIVENWPKAAPNTSASQTTRIPEATLVDQPKGKELEYRIIAINKSGDGSPSNTMMVVL